MVKYLYKGQKYIKKQINNKVYINTVYNTGNI
jgi:hypothetical protein